MRKLILSALSAGVIGMMVSVQADPEIKVADGIPVSILPIILGPAMLPEDVLSDGNLLLWLMSISDNNPDLPSPTPFVSDYIGGSIAAGDYLVLNYSGQDRGVLDAFYFPSDLSNFTIPVKDNSQLLFARLFDHVAVPGVPDGGTTMALLGLGMAGIGFVRRQFTTGS